MKEQEIEALQHSGTENASIFATQEAELKRLQELEASNTTQQDLLRKQVDEANQKISTLEAEIAASKTDRESSQELEKRLGMLQTQLAHKEEERLLIQKEPSTADTAKLALEAGKAKAKGEIHALLLRVQDSERWMKNIQEKLQAFGISTSAESFPETWSKLEMLLQTAIASGFPNLSTNNSLKQVDCTPGVANMLSTPRKVCQSPSQGFVQTTEVICRTQNIPRSAYVSPSADCEQFQSAAASTTIDTVPDSQMSNIIPFSSFQKQLSPVHCSSPVHDANDFTKVLTQIPPKECPGQELNAPEERGNDHLSSSTTEKEVVLLSRDKGANEKTRQSDGNFNTPEKQAQGASVMAEGSSNRTPNADCSGGKHKVVTFDDQGTRLKRKTSEESFRGNQRTTDFINERRPMHQNRRTYSKIRQNSPMRQHGRAPDKADTLSTARETRDGKDFHHDNRNKRARKSTGSGHCRQQRRSQNGPEAVERRLNPASLASGSSRHTAVNEDTNKRWTSRRPRPGRRTRGKTQEKAAS